MVNARRVWIFPDPVHDLFDMADERQHREHRLHEEAICPLPSSTEFEVGRIPRSGMESRTTQDDHASVDLANQPLQGVLCNIGGGTVPPHDQAILVHQQTPCAPDNPAMIREPFTADLLWAAPLAHGVDQLDPVRVDDAEHGRSGQEALRPILVGLEEAKKAGALG